MATEAKLLPMLDLKALTAQQGVELVSLNNRAKKLQAELESKEMERLSVFAENKELKLRMETQPTIATLEFELMSMKKYDQFSSHVL